MLRRDEQLNRGRKSFACALVVAALIAASGRGQEPPAAVDFGRDIAPIFEQSCNGCHGAGRAMGQLRLDDKRLALKGGISGPAIVPGKSGESRLLQRILGEGGEARMPLGADPLGPAQIALVRAWIDQGAPWPEAAAGAGPQEAELPKHWAYVKPRRPAPPAVKDAALSAWPRNPIDNFVLARLEKEGLKPSPEADRATLIRRVSLDLTGLPPGPAEVDAFVADRSPDAYEKLVDRLLASPHYGERWARPWLDLARYADSNGYEKDRPRVMWKYRDWVIDALNRDMPFDQFTVEQIAGDMLPDATTAQKIATGFHRNTLMNQEDGVDPDEHRWDNIVDRVATTATVWLGTTLACAQCHNHKYDPFSQQEFYKFFAFYDSTDYVITGAAHTQRFVEPVLDLPTPEQEARRGELQAEIAELETVLKTQTPELDAAQAEWERAQLAEGANWAVLDPAEFKSTGGSTLAKLDDKSLLATGANPESDVYVITARTDLKGIRAVRVEGLPDSRLPQGGPGRDPYGNFLLTGIEVAAGGQRIELGHAGVDDSAFRFDGKMFFKEEAYAGVKDMPKGWSIDATRDAKRLARQGVFVFARPLGGGAGTVLTVKIKHQGGVLGQGIGRLRLSVTAGEEPLRVVSLPAKARPLLETPASERAPAQREELAAQFRLLAPALKPARDRLADLRLALKELGIVTALILQERPSNERPSTDLRERGSFLSKGEKVYAGTPAALHPFPESQPYNRLGLARWLVDGNNPLVARVTVNRFWEQIFGRGIVETSEDFGTQSAPPSHPELLDYLATEFVGQKWSMKRMHRLIVTSAAYRQSSDASAALLEKDPYNRLLGRGPRFRMEAEMVRDAALAAAGLLSPKVGGPSVFPPQPEGIWRNPYSDDKWKASEGEDRYRRGLYTFLRRTSPYPGFLTFDATSREVCIVRRVRTNTPLQALTTLNDEAFFEAARALARRMLREGPAETRGRIALGFRLCATRAPQPAEADRLAALYKQQLAYYRTRAREAAQVTQGEPSAELAAWTLVANVLLNLDETLTKR